MTKWALLHDSRLEIINHDPYGSYHPDIQFKQVPDWLDRYITEQYVLNNGELIPPSKEYLKNQFKVAIKIKAERLLYVGIIYGNNKYDSSVINDFLPYLNTKDSIFWENKFGELFQLNQQQRLRIYYGTLDYQQSILRRKYDLNIHIDNNDYFNENNPVWDLKNKIENTENIIQKGWPPRELKEEQDELSRLQILAPLG